MDEHAEISRFIIPTGNAADFLISFTLLPHHSYLKPVSRTSLLISVFITNANVRVECLAWLRANIQWNQLVANLHLNLFAAAVSFLLLHNSHFSITPRCSVASIQTACALMRCLVPRCAHSPFCLIAFYDTWNGSWLSESEFSKLRFFWKLIAQKSSPYLIKDPLLVSVQNLCTAVTSPRTQIEENWSHVLVFLQFVWQMICESFLPELLHEVSLIFRLGR